MFPLHDYYEEVQPPESQFSSNDIENSFKAYDYEYEYEDYGEGLGDTQFVIRSDGTIQNVSDLLSQEAIAVVNISFNESIWKNEAIPTERIVTATSFLVLFVLGLLGNIMVVYTVWRYAGMRRVTYFLLVNLAFTNLLYLILGLPTLTVSYLLSDWPFGKFFCKFDNYVMSVSMSVSILTIMATGFDRYLAVVYPIRSRRFRTGNVSLLVIAVTWIASLVCMVPRWHLYETRLFVEDKVLCNRVGTTYIKRLDSGLRFALLYILPLVVLTVCHLRIGRALWARGRLRNMLDSKARGRIDRQRREERRNVGSEAPGDSCGDGCVERIYRQHSSDTQKYQPMCCCSLRLCNPRYVKRNNVMRWLHRNETAHIETQRNLGEFKRFRCGMCWNGFECGYSSSQVATIPLPPSCALTMVAARERRRMAKIAVALTAVFALGWLPLHLYYLLEDFQWVDPDLLPTLLERANIVLLFCFGANALNPFLYCAFSSNFRHHFKMALSQICCGSFNHDTLAILAGQGNLEHTKRIFQNNTVDGRGNTFNRRLRTSAQRPERAKHAFEAENEARCGIEEDYPLQLYSRPRILQPRPASLLSSDIVTERETCERMPFISQAHILTLPGECSEGDGQPTSVSSVTSVVSGKNGSDAQPPSRQTLTLANVERQATPSEGETEARGWVSHRFQWRGL